MVGLKQIVRGVRKRVWLPKKRFHIPWGLVFPTPKGYEFGNAF